MDLKKCSGCKISKPKTEFWKNRSTYDGLNSYCKPCWLLHIAKYQRSIPREKYLLIRRKWHLGTKYRLTQEEYEKLLNSQNNGCAICGKTKDLKKSLAVDHDEKTEKIRGILCENCNRGIGLLRHDIKLLESAIIYLKKFDELSQ